MLTKGYHKAVIGVVCSTMLTEIYGLRSRLNVANVSHGCCSCMVATKASSFLAGDFALLALIMFTGSDPNNAPNNDAMKLTVYSSSRLRSSLGLLM